MSARMSDMRVVAEGFTPGFGAAAGAVRSVGDALALIAQHGTATLAAGKEYLSRFSSQSRFPARHL